jgi:hypothetical protein
MVQLPTIEIKELDLTQKVENKSQIKKKVSFHFTSSSKCYCPIIRKYYSPKEFPGCAPWTDDTPEYLSLPRPTNRKNKKISGKRLLERTNPRTCILYIVRNTG